MRERIGDLLALMAVARERSFTRAAARLGVSQSSLSQNVLRLEKQLGLKLLARTTRSVSLTEVGQKFIDNIGVHIEGIDNEFAALEQLRDRPQGTVRISSTTSAISAVLWPKLSPVLKNHPDIKVEIIGNNQFLDIVAEGFDAGVRLGEHVAKDMIAVRIGPELRMVCVASPAYLASNPAPKTPKDLVKHQCINLRLLRSGEIYQWEFQKGKRSMNVRVEGQVTFADGPHLLQAALDGYGIAYIGQDLVAPHIASGTLVQLLDDWCPPFAGYHLYYPSRMHGSSAFSIIVEALRYRG